MTDRWHYMIGADRHGPVPRDELEKLVDSGRLQPNGLVWQEGAADWVPARDLFLPERFHSPIAEGAPALPPLPTAEPLDRPRQRYGGRDRADVAPHDVPYPAKLRAAGIIWVVIGGVILVGNAISVLLALSAGAGGDRTFVSGVMCSSILVGLFGGAFILVGVQSIVGSAPGTMGNGIGSIILGAIVFAVGLAAGLGGRLILALVIAGLEAAALIAAGILAIMSQTEYSEWRYVHKAPARFRR